MKRIMASPDHNVIVSMLVTMLSMVIIVGVFFVYLVLRRRHLKTLNPAEGRSLDELASALAVKGPRLGLKRPNCWLAIQKYKT